VRQSVATFSAAFDATPESFDASARDAYRDWLAATTNVTADDIDLRVVAASIVVIATIRTQTDAAAAATATSLGSITATDVAVALVNTSAANLTVIKDSIHTAVEVIIIPAPSPPPSPPPLAPPASPPPAGSPTPPFPLRPPYGPSDTQTLLVSAVKDDSMVLIAIIAVAAVVFVVFACVATHLWRRKNKSAHSISAQEWRRNAAQSKSTRKDKSTRANSSTTEMTYTHNIHNLDSVSATVTTPRGSLKLDDDHKGDEKFDREVVHVI